MSQALLRTESIVLPEETVRFLCANQDEHVRHLERAFGVEIGARGDEFHVAGEEQPVKTVVRLLGELGELSRGGHRLRAHDLQTGIRVLQESPEASLVEFFDDRGPIATASRLVAPRSINQRRYLQAMVQNDLVISIGPAGTGKTFLAVAMAAAFLIEKRVRRIVLARPAVEAGEKLGFLPGDLAEKVNPYLRPLYDSLNDILGFEKVGRMMEREVIEVAPLAFMRGRTLNESFVILDEAQNTTPEQMKMLLTRIGNGSKAVVNGDVTQVDLPQGHKSGLREVQEILKDVKGVAFVAFTQRDVVRHELVKRIVAAYDDYEARVAQTASRSSGGGQRRERANAPSR